jgi:hypothetical protein
MPDSEYEYIWQSNVYGTHQPFLESYVRSTTGDVLEFGTGNGSTGLLRNILAGSGRKLVSIEDNIEWLQKMKNLYTENGQHTFVYLEPKDNGDHWKEFLKSYQHSNKVSVVFIDQAPWEARLWTLSRFLKDAEYCIIHDADYFCLQSYSPNDGMLGYITNASLPYTDENKYCFNLENYKLYFPPAPWTDNRHGPPTLVTSGSGCPIIKYSDILF